MQKSPASTYEGTGLGLESICKKHGLNLTIQRRAILEALMSSSDHPTADQLYGIISSKLKGVSRTTVYRVLDAFVSIGIAKKISNPQSKARFDADMSRHDHLVCMNCGLVIDLFDQNLCNLQVPAGVHGDFRVMDYSITFTGLCEACNKEQRGRNGAKQLPE